MSGRLVISRELFLSSDVNETVRIGEIRGITSLRAALAFIAFIAVVAFYQLRIGPADVPC